MSMAWQLAKSAWESQTRTMSFETLLGRYVADGGVVWSTPKEFLLACPVVVAADGAMVHSAPRANAWFVHLAALADAAQSPGGLVATLTRVAPYPLPWVVWQRARTQKLHRHTWEAVMKQAQKFTATRLTYGKS
jgi:hypothetical protein